MSYEGTKISSSRLPAATGGALGAIITGANVTNTAGTISVTGSNVTTALGYTPENAANKNAASGYAGLDASSLLTPAQLPFATGAVRGAVITGTNITNTAGTISLTNGNVVAALGYTPVNKAGDTMTGALTLSADPTNALHAATKQYVDGVAAGLDPKASVKVATTANITLSGTQTIDGVAVAASDRVLVKNQSTGTQNGVYVCAAGAWSRASDFDGTPTGEVSGGAFMFVEQGSTYADTGWVVTNNGAVTVGTDTISFTQFSGAGSFNAGAGLTQTGNTLDIVAADSTITVNADSIQVGALSLTNAHINAAAGIVDTKLATISSAGKVADTALSANIAKYDGTTAFTAKQTFVAATTGGASVNVPHGTAPTTPANGDMWSTTTGFFARINGTTEEFAVLSANTFTGIQITAASTTGTAGFRLPHGAAPTTPTNGDVWTTTAGLFARINGATLQFGTGSGTVTSVALTVPAFLSVAGSPVTSAGTLAVTLATQTANAVFAGPAAGADAAPTFRALVKADIPNKTIRVVTAAGAVTVVTTDDIVIVNKTAGAATAATLPASPATGDTYTIKDGKGDAATNPITVSPAAGTIDGAATAVIDQDYGARVFVYNGTEWNLL